MNRVVQHLLRHYIKPSQDDWDEQLPLIASLYNNAVHNSTDICPNELHLGWKPRSTLDFLLPENRPAATPGTLEYGVQYEKLLQEAVEHMKKAQQAMIASENQHRRQSSFQAGERVWVKASELGQEFGISRKLMPQYFGPWEVLDIVGDELDGPTYVIRNPGHLCTHPVFHASKLAPFAETDQFPSRRSMLPPTMDGQVDFDDIVDHRDMPVAKPLGRGRPPKPKREYLVRFRHHTDPKEDRWFTREELIETAPQVVAEYEKLLKGKAPANATSAVPRQQQCHVSNSATSAVPRQQCHVSSATSAVPRQSHCHVISATSAVPRQQLCHLALIEAEEQHQLAAKAARLQAEAAATAEKQRLQAEANADTQARRKEAQDLLQRHETASIERLKFWHFQPSNGDDTTPEEHHKEFLSKLVTRLLYACNYQQSELERQNHELQQQYQDLKTQHPELANLRRIVQSHDDATRALNSRVLDLEQAVPGQDAGESNSAPSNRQLEQRVDHVVAMLDNISTFAAPTTICNQLDTLKTEVQQLQLTNTDDNNPLTYYKTQDTAQVSVQQPVSVAIQPLQQAPGPIQPMQWMPKIPLLSPKPFSSDRKKDEDLDTWVRTVPTYVRHKLTRPEQEVVVASSFLEGSAAHWLNDLVQQQGYGQNFDAWAQAQTLEEFVRSVCNRWHDPQGAQKATDAINSLCARRYKNVCELTDTVERLVVVPGVRYDQHVLLTDYLRCLPSEVRTKLVDEAYVEQHNFASCSKKALDIEAKLGSAHQSQGDGRKKRLPQDWKKKRQLMFVDHDGQTTDIDEFPDLGDETEHDGASETSDGGVVAPIKEKARGTGKKKIVYRVLDLVWVYAEVQARLDNTKKFCTKAIEDAKVVAPEEEEARPRRERVKVKFPDSYNGKKGENFDNWEANINSYVHLRDTIPKERVLMTFHALKDEASSFTRSLARATKWRGKKLVKALDYGGWVEVEVEEGEKVLGYGGWVNEVEVEEGDVKVLGYGGWVKEVGPKEDVKVLGYGGWVKEVEVEESVKVLGYGGWVKEEVRVEEGVKMLGYGGWVKEVEVKEGAKVLRYGGWVKVAEMEEDMKVLGYGGWVKEVGLEEGVKVLGYGGWLKEVEVDEGVKVLGYGGWVKDVEFEEGLNTLGYGGWGKEAVVEEDVKVLGYGGWAKEVEVEEDVKVLGDGGWVELEVEKGAKVLGYGGWVEEVEVEDGVKVARGVPAMAPGKSTVCSSGAKQPARITSNVRFNLQFIRLLRQMESSSGGRTSRPARPNTSYRRKRKVEEDEESELEYALGNPDAHLYNTNDGVVIVPPVLLVDGYNMCGYWPKLKKHFSRGNLALARDKLIQEMAMFGAIKVHGDERRSGAAASGEVWRKGIQRMATKDNRELRRVGMCKGIWCMAMKEGRVVMGERRRVEGNGLGVGSTAGYSRNRCGALVSKGVVEWCWP
ncbi:hypothetical protein CBR_g49407 [Chara braunii]|uniref:Tf2-1-like SH3-like domain-containing protein n=1 Tax=Chara braunii TaxID=69332 RepID=A0A388M4V8_CHABU|nr:hypothetical protein CBR_g49407 [Chara braunii]|eukprot:GBG89617.1 hypothetical protein CBR_g49407 [Chara braunii]